MAKNGKASAIVNTNNNNMQHIINDIINIIIIISQLAGDYEGALQNATEVKEIIEEKLRKSDVDEVCLPPPLFFSQHTVF